MMNQDWLKELDQDLYWCQDAIDNLPSVIAHEYSRVRDMVKSRQVYGLSMQIKDAFETIIKYEVLVISAWSYTRNEIRNQYEETIGRMIVRENLAFGTWVAIAGEILKFYNERELPDYMKNCLKTIRHEYEKNRIVEWRNKEIGHGALGFEDSVQFQNSIIGKIKFLTRLLQTLLPGLRRQMLYIDSLEMKGKDKARGVSITGSITIRDNSTGVSFGIEPWLTLREGNIYFFDNQMKKKRTQMLSYPNGSRFESFNEFFSAIPDQAVSESISQTHEMALDDQINVEINRLINGISVSEDFVAPDYLTDLLRDMLGKHSSGLFMLRMNRGMGKSCYTEKLSNLCKNPIRLFDDMEVRTYHVSRSVIRGNSEFEGEIEGQWKQVYSGLDREDRDRQTWWDSSVTSMARYREQHLSVSESFVAFLKDARKWSNTNRGFNRILMVIDGIDEIREDAKSGEKTIANSIWDHINIAGQLPEGVYILLTSRDAKTEELPQDIIDHIKKLESVATDSACVLREDKYNTDFLKMYIHDCGMHIEPSQMEALLTYSEYRILYLRMLCSLIGSGTSIEELLNNGSNSVAKVYLDALEHYYGDKEAKHLREILALFSTLGDCTSLSLNEIASFVNGGLINLDLLGKMKDIEAMLTLERGYEAYGIYRTGDTRYKFANPGLADAYRQIIQDEVKEMIYKLTDYAFSADAPNPSDADRLILVWAHLYDMHEMVADDEEIIYPLCFPHGAELDGVLSFFNTEATNALMDSQLSQAALSLRYCSHFSYESEQRTLNCEEVVQCQLAAAKLLARQRWFKTAIETNYAAVAIAEDDSNCAKKYYPEIYYGLGICNSKLSNKTDSIENLNKMVAFIEKRIEDCTDTKEIGKWNGWLFDAVEIFLNNGMYNSALSILPIVKKLGVMKSKTEEEQILSQVSELVTRSKILADCGLPFAAKKTLRQLQNLLTKIDDFRTLAERGIDSEMEPYYRGMIVADEIVLDSIKRQEKREGKLYLAERAKYYMDLEGLTRDWCFSPIKAVRYSKLYKATMNDMRLNKKESEQTTNQQSKPALTVPERCLQRWQEKQAEYYSGRKTSAIGAALYGLYYGELLLDKGDSEAAVSAIDQALLLDSAERHYMVQVEGNRLKGEALMKSGKVGDAVTAFIEAIKWNDKWHKKMELDSVETIRGILCQFKIETELQDALLELGNIDEAIRRMQKWINDDALVHDAKGIISSYEMIKRIRSIEKRSRRRMLTWPYRIKQYAALFFDIDEASITRKRVKIPKGQYISKWHEFFSKRWASHYYPRKDDIMRIWTYQNPYKSDRRPWLNEHIGKRVSWKMVTTIMAAVGIMAMVATGAVWTASSSFPTIGFVISALICIVAVIVWAITDYRI